MLLLSTLPALTPLVFILCLFLHAHCRDVALAIIQSDKWEEGLCHSDGQATPFGRMIQQMPRKQNASLSLRIYNRDVHFIVNCSNDQQGIYLHENVCSVFDIAFLILWYNLILCDNGKSLDDQTYLDNR